MPITARIWKYKKPTDPGHASLELSDGTYISWWPKTDPDKPDHKTAVKQTVSKTAPDKERTLAKDIFDEGGDGPARSFTLPDRLNLDEGKISAWWNAKKEEEKYNLIRNNCSTTVKEALKVGGLTVTHDFMDTPDKTMAFFEDLVQPKGPKTN